MGIIMKGHKQYGGDSADLNTSAISDKFDPNKSYSIGDYVIKDSIMYKFTSNKNPGAWNASLVKPTNLSNEVKECTSKVEDCFQSVSNGKALVASAIADKGIATGATDTFAKMAKNLESIEIAVNSQSGLYGPYIVGNNSYANALVSFPIAFKSVPSNISARMYILQGGTQYNQPITIFSKSKKGFLIRSTEEMDSTYSMYVQWSASL